MSSKFCEAQSGSALHKHDGLTLDKLALAGFV
jgi:hypothetical protein